MRCWAFHRVCVSEDLTGPGSCPTFYSSETRDRERFQDSRAGSVAPVASSRPPTAGSSSVVRDPAPRRPRSVLGPCVDRTDRCGRRWARPSSTGPASRSTDDRPEARRLELRAERVGVADEDDRGVRQAGRACGRGLDVLDRDRLDRRPVASQLVVAAGRGSTSPASAPTIGARRLEPEREHADQEVAGRGRARRRVTGARRGSARARRSMSTIAGHRHLGVHRGAGGERPGARGGGRSRRRRRTCSPSPRGASCSAGS